MKKYLQLVAFKRSDDAYALFVDKQEFRGREFALDTYRFTASNDILLNSVSCPAIEGENIMFLKGDEVYLDNLCMGIVNTSKLDQIKIAVDEYNEFMNERLTGKVSVGNADDGRIIYI